MWQKVLAFASFMTSGILGMLMFDEKLILKPKWFVIIAVLTIVVHYTIRFLTAEKNKTIDHFIIMTFSIYLALALTSLIYTYWIFGNFIPAAFIMKLSLILFVLTAVYLNFVLLKAKTTYKKKRENERIEQIKSSLGEKPLSKLIKLLNFKKKQSKSYDPADKIQLVLGEAAQSISKKS